MMFGNRGSRWSAGWITEFLVGREKGVVALDCGILHFSEFDGKREHCKTFGQAILDLLLYAINVIAS